MTTDKAALARRRASRLPYVGALVAIGAFVVMAWANQHRLEPVVVGRPAPNFTVTNLRGEPVQLADYRGKVILVNIWATWCPPCIREMPSIERLYQTVRMQPGGEDFEVLAVSVDASADRPNALGGVTREDLAAFAADLELTFPIVHDSDRKVERMYQTTGVPETFIIGRDGNIYLKWASEAEWDSQQYVDLIRRLLDS
jgi:Peroxiredoxin